MTQTLDITASITATLDSIDGAVSSRSRVIDALLDLRNAAGARDDLVRTIDRLLLDLPGLTTVPNDWWTGALQGLLTQCSAPLG